MAAPVTIALDAMGGDHGPGVIVAGASISLVRHPDTRFLLVGDAGRIEADLKSHTALPAKAEILHTDVAVAMDAKPSQALRKGRRHSSMWLSLEAVRDGRADAAVSAGNTGALMAMAKFCLKTIPGVDRPAIAVQWPTVESECIVLDVGANIGTHTVAVAKKVTDRSVVVAFEPQRLTYQVLCGNVALNALTNVLCQNVVVSDEPGSMLIRRWIRRSSGISAR